MRNTVTVTVASLALATASALVACSGTLEPSGPASEEPRETTIPADDTASESAGSAGQPTEGTTSLAFADATSIKVAVGYCGAAPGVCYGTSSSTIHFASATLEKTVDCETGSDAGPTTTTRSLDDAELRRVRDALAAVRVTTDPRTSNDGRMYVLTVETPSGDRHYSPEVNCGHGTVDKISAGFDTLWTTVTAL